MALPAVFTAALAQPGITPDLWVEIEGIPWAFGLTARAGSFFSGRPAAERREGVLGTLLGPPAGVEQEARPLDGDSSIGSMSVSLVLDPDGRALSLVAGTARQDGQLSLRAPSRAQDAPYVVGDVVKYTDAGGDEVAYRCTVGGTTANAAATPGVGVTPYVDGTATFALLGPVDLEAATTPAGIPYTGTADATRYPLGGGVIFIGRETFGYASRVTGGNGTGAFLGLTRGKYALPARSALYAHTEADVISWYPRFLATRRATVFATLDGTDANRVARWAGTIRNAKLTQGNTCVELPMESVESDLRRKVFKGQRTGKLLAGIANGTGAYERASDVEPANETTRLVLEPASLAGEWTDGATVIVRVGDEYVSGTIAVGSETAVTVTARGLFSSLSEQHEPGTEVREVIWTGAYDAAGTPEFQASKFTKGDHPLEWALQVLLSKKGDGANGEWDVLPEGWGIGIDQARIDVAGILALRGAWLPSARHLWVYDEPFTFKEELAQVLRPHLCYPVTQLDDLFTIRRLNPPIPGETLRVLGPATRVGVPTWDANVQMVVGHIDWLCDYDPAEDEPRQKFLGELQGPGTEAQEFYAELYDSLTIEARGQFTGNDPGAVGFFGAGLQTSAAEAAQRYFEIIRDRYARPFPTIGDEHSFDCLDVEVGDLVLFTAENLPNVATGAVGLSGVVCEVLSRRIDDDRGTVSFKLLHSAAPPQYRLLAPSGIVDSTAAGRLNLTGAFDEAGFVAGDVLEVRSPDLATLRGTATVTGTEAGAVLVDAVPAGSVAGDAVLLAPYGSQPALTKARDAFLADADGELAAGAAAHVYAS
jgi:hypothetical protein